jgi:signal transduction histidine kinase
MKHGFMPKVAARESSDIWHIWVLDIALILALVLIPNLLFIINLEHYASAPNLWWWDSVRAGVFEISLHEAIVWLGFNIAVLGVLITLRHFLLLPLRHIAGQLHHLHEAYQQDTGRSITSPLQVGRIARDLSRFASFAMEHYHKHQESAQALEQSRHIIAQFAIEQQAILNSTNHEISTQYRAVLSYAHYLEGQITTNKLDPSLRYDLDDICESSFNLKLIAGALTMLRAPATQEPANVPIAPLLQQTVLALAPALDRRSMKLTSAEVDMSVAAYGDATTLAHILWMMLLGMIRYAADESTLRIRILYSRDGTQAMLSIVISELSPGRMSEDERGEHLVRQLQHLTPHMFAETIRIHGNVQLAHLLITRLGGMIDVEPLTTSSCEICVKLPSAHITQYCS